MSAAAGNPDPQFAGSRYRTGDDFARSVVTSHGIDGDHPPRCGPRLTVVGVREVAS
jgi:hypothetical protein